MPGVQCKPGDGSLTSSEATTEPTTFRLWPGDGVGALRGVVHAPDKPGVYQVIVSADGLAATTPSSSLRTRRIRRRTIAIVAAWTQAEADARCQRRGSADLPAELRRAIRPTPRRETCI